MLSTSIQKANLFRRVLDQIRQLAYATEIAPIGSLEMLVAEMLALHYCSDYDEALIVLKNLLEEIQNRIENNIGVLPKNAARIFWVNPTADIKVMNVLEACGGRVCGTEYLFSHALDIIPESIDPIEALAQAALGDLMVGSTNERTQRIQQDIKRFAAEGVIISRIPGASHCAWEGMLIANKLRQSTNLPMIEIEVPSLCDATEPSIQTRLEALIETIKQRRQS
jgi:benzoyl-CoA reductase/2-hydroxyglutaryl-CoA dehydratase subunit BcrC/BadD/HgdB